MKKVKEIRHKFLPELFNISYKITDNCNHDCNYCSQRTTGQKFKSKKEIVDHFRLIRKVVLENTSFTYFDTYFTGGEPTLHPQFKEILAEIYDLYKGQIHIHVQSNTTRSLKWYQDLNNYKYGNKIKFSSSFQYNALKDPVKWYHNVLYLRDTGRLESISFMLEQEQSDIIVNHYNLFRKEKLPIKLTFVDAPHYQMPDVYNAIIKDTELNTKDEEGNPIEYIVTFDDGSIEECSELTLRQKGYNNCFLMKCEAGYKSIMIDTNGALSFCFSHYFKTRTQQGLNINNGEEDLLKIIKPQICLWKKCQCELWLKKYV